MKIFMLAVMLGCWVAQPAGSQIIAGTPEDKQFQRITAETNLDSKLEELSAFERQFPESKVLTDIYLMMIDVYRQKNDRLKMIECGEKILKVDAANVTAMMVLARNYAIDGKNLDRAVTLARQAVDQIGKLKQQPAPAPYSAEKWKEYLDGTQVSAEKILTYARSIRGQKAPN